MTEADLALYWDCDLSAIQQKLTLIERITRQIYELETLIAKREAVEDKERRKAKRKADRLAALDSDAEDEEAEEDDV